MAPDDALGAPDDALGAHSGDKSLESMEPRSASFLLGERSVMR